MRLGRIGEFGAIGRIGSLCRRPGREVSVGIGDDAAAFGERGRLTLATADMMVEGVHFDPALSGWREVGYKALSSNMSDIAAMGGIPRYYMVSLAMPAAMTVEALDGLFLGMELAAKPHRVRLIGGDTSASPGPVVVSVTVLGEAGPKGVVTRSGARPGDDLYVTGTLGDSAAGLELLKSGAGGRGPVDGKMRSKPGNGGGDYLVSRHLMPAARVGAGRLLAGVASSMIDISDGFSSDLAHILEASGAGARVLEDAVPVSRELLSYAGRKRALGFALHGGEDYELMFTARPRARKKVADAAAGARLAVSRVGEITGETGAFLVSGKGSQRSLRPGGYEHFRK